MQLSSRRHLSIASEETLPDLSSRGFIAQGKDVERAGLPSPSDNQMARWVAPGLFGPWNVSPGKGGGSARDPLLAKMRPKRG